jgi:hypothetical protein
VVACLERLEPLPVLAEASWRRLIDDVHGEFGAVVAKQWALPEPIAEVIVQHHAPGACMRIHRSLVMLVAVVDHVIAVLDRAGTGIAALAEVPGLEPDERVRIGALIPKVAEQMAVYEAPIARQPASPIEPEPAALAGGWPIDVELTGANRSYRAVAISRDAIALRSPVELAPAWLIQLAIGAPPDTISMLANVKRCQPDANGGFLVVAQPFGLDGDDALGWQRLLERTHPKP